MDFELDEDVAAAGDLAAEICGDRASSERVAAVEADGTRVDDKLWDEFARAGLLGLAVPEEFGGAGLGMGAVCAVLHQLGRHVAPVPVWTAAVAGRVIADHGSLRQRRELLAPTVDGTARTTVGLEEFGAADPAAPTCAARPDRQGWRVSGSKACVPDWYGAHRVLVSAATPDGAGVFLVDPGAEGVAAEWAETTSRQLCAHVTFDDVCAERVGDSAALPALLDLASLALAALQLGVAEGALRHAATYLGQRQQFGRALATFQAVAHQLADCYIDLECMSVTLWEAAWSWDNGEEVDKAVRVARWWADDAGQRVVHRVQHLHGGIGVDTDYPVHRHYLWAKQLAGTLGSPSADLAGLGAVLAAESGAGGAPTQVR